jgi:hypothetical protein
VIKSCLKIYEKSDVPIWNAQQNHTDKLRFYSAETKELGFLDQWFTKIPIQAHHLQAKPDAALIEWRSLIVS